MEKKYKVLILLISFISLFSITCSDIEEKSIAEGEELAKVSCASCHQFPDPSLLDRETWKTSVLPFMAEMMYVEKYYSPFNNSGPQGNVPETRAAPEKLFPYDKWEKIVKYYLSTAPKQALTRKEELNVIEKELPHFSTHYVYDEVSLPVITLVKIDTVAHEIIFGDGNSGQILKLNKELKTVDSIKTGIGVVDYSIKKNGVSILTMGIMRPSDELLGKLTIKSGSDSPLIIADSLNRSVHASCADLNGDIKEDIVICEFGFRKGSLSWFENKDKNNYEKHLLRELPGAIRTEVYDFNKDGLPDIAAMMAQGDEGIFIYYNEGNGKFSEERVLRFPPSYGSNYFQILDFNNDGFIDILTTNGDNGDYSIILKPYHGIRIFLNDGKNQFTEKIFLPVHGIQKAMPADFDNDGDIDLASIAFFPDYDLLPEEGFIYWENSGNFNFKRYTFGGFADGRWMTMDAADVDSDGDKDIVLGNAFFTMGNVPKAMKDKWSKRPLSIVFLENKIK